MVILTLHFHCSIIRTSHEQQSECIFFSAADGQPASVHGREPGRAVRAQPDGAVAAEGLPGHQELHRSQAGDGGREREAGELEDGVSSSLLLSQS